MLKKIVKNAACIVAAAFVLFGSTFLQIKTYSEMVGSEQKKEVPSYVYYDFDNWRRYISTEEPNCRHKNAKCYRYVEDGQHSVFCSDCGVIFGYEYCFINNDRYSAPLDYYHDRCLTCLHKEEYVYRPYVKDKSNREYID